MNWGLGILGSGVGRQPQPPKPQPHNPRHQQQYKKKIIIK